MLIWNLLKLLGWFTLLYILVKGGGGLILLVLLFIVMGVIKAFAPKE
jgi:hypothetical protein